MRIYDSIAFESSIHSSQQRSRPFSRLLLLCLTVVLALITALLIMQSLHHVSLATTGHAGIDGNLDNVIGQTDSHQMGKSSSSYYSYLTATVLQELVGENTVELSSALDKLGSFSILKEGDTYYLWLNSFRNSPLPRQGIEQRLESQDGVVWSNRTDTDLALLNDGSYKFLWGLRSMIKRDDTYLGWETYYYESSLGWARAVRYVTSTNGISWTVVSEPSLIGTAGQSVIEDGGTFHMWARVDVDGQSYPSEPEITRHRTSTDGSSGWGHWQTGGGVVTIDGETSEAVSRVRLGDGGTYQLFYVAGNQIHLATSVDGIAFTTQITNVLDLAVVLPDMQSLADFEVVDSGAGDWFYFAYQGQDDVYRIAVSRPQFHIYLPAIMYNYTPLSTFPLHIGDMIPARQSNYTGEVFYTASVHIPTILPSSGHFYLSSQPDAVAEVLVDDEIAILSGSTEIFTYDFSTGGIPQPAIVEIPRPTMEQLAGQTITVKYRDVYGSIVYASAIWLIWTP